MACSFLTFRTVLCLLVQCYLINSVNGFYNVGVGIADATGPAAEINFMGYASLGQSGMGIHLRQFARAFIFEKDGARIVFCSIDTGMVGIGIKREVIKKLRSKFGNLYNTTNVILSGTHTHSAPGGHLIDFLFDLSILGFVKDTFIALSNGIVRSISRAHDNIQPARLYYSETTVLNANINRSPTSYLANPEEERAKYEYDVDKKLTQLKIVDPSNDHLIGVINWFAVHPTSMNNTNRLVSSDNVGYASILLETALNPKGTLPGKGHVVAAVASSNLGDVSPNIQGPRCEFTGRPCDQYSSYCPKEDGSCFASGPGKNMFESTKIIAERIYKAAIGIIDDRNKEITGDLQIAHQFVNMPKEEVADYDPIRKTFLPDKLVHGCVPAMGYSFAAGTTDGPGAFNFSQGTTSGNKLWDTVRDFLAEPTEEDVKCQSPKPILFATGRIKFPYDWQPSIVATQLALIGNLAVIAVPGEFTTMSGRRVRDVVRRSLEPSGKRFEVVIAGLSNTYSDYIATPEEYQLQRYEAASTIYGPNTLTIYLNKYKELAQSLITKKLIPRGTPPPNLLSSVISLVPPVIFDSALWKLNFGDVLEQPRDLYNAGETAKVVFISGHPRNNVLQERSFANIEQLQRGQDDSKVQWKVVATDANWETRFLWKRSSKIMGTSNAIIYWDIPYDVEPGTYRIHHYGYYKFILGGIYPYEGISDSFEVSSVVINM